MPIQRAVKIFYLLAVTFKTVVKIRHLFFPAMKDPEYEIVAALVVKDEKPQPNLQPGRSHGDSDLRNKSQ